jgi:ubiquinone/menaquinone biosynthesis C-methylase UbiE
MENGENTVVRRTPDADYYIRMLEVFHPLRESMLQSAIEVLQLPSGSRGLDAGCGIGLPALLLAEAVGPNGHVTGLDVSPEFLAYAKGIAEKAGLAERIAFQEGDINRLPFDDQTFDWVWSTDCAGYRVKEPLPLFKELTRIIKPGGTLSLLFWSSQTLLPGYPLLEARLNATSAGIAPFKKGMKSETHYLRTLKWMRAVGVEEATAHTFIGEVQAPLSEKIRSALIALFQMRWEQAESEVTQEDWTKYQRLCQPESPDCILNFPEYYAFFTYSMFYGKVAQ